MSFLSGVLTCRASESVCKFGTRAACLLVFFLLVSIALGFALYTDHRWEDWYITYRASKNMGLGNGLVFNVGERVHSFTSPIGTLIPAFYAWLTSGNDEAVIWLFRITCAIPFALTGVVMLRLTQWLQFSKLAAVLMIGLYGTNMLIVDFTINGMETAFMMLFLSLFVYLLVVQPKQFFGKMVLLIAALMYTRPDSFVYAGAIGLGFLIFSPRIAADGRLKFIGFMLKALAVAALLYLPWLIGTWMYYGTPIPHTITAKAGSRTYDLSLLSELLRYPLTLFTPVMVTHGFLPPYSNGPSWHPFSGAVSQWLTTIGALAFVFAWRNPYARAVSVGAFFSSFYLNSVSGQNATPWYVPMVVLMVILVVGMLANQWMKAPKLKRTRPLLVLLVVVLLGNSLFVLAMGAFGMKTQQQVIEFGHRKQIGLWLKEHAKTEKDTVFMECLGYIGFYSEMKPYDYPGMSSPESVASIKKFGPGAPYAYVINDLKPDWVVLRSFEIEKANKDMPGLLEEQYIQRKVFDARDKIPQDMLGHGYLDYDAVFTIFERKQ